MREEDDRTLQDWSVPLAGLKKLGIESFLEVELLTALSKGRRTVAELVQELYNVERSNPAYASYYDRVRRGCRRLESKGLVSRRIFGRDKPYRLTEHGILAMNRARMGQVSQRVLNSMDAALYLATILFGLIAVSTTNSSALHQSHYLGIFTIFVLLTGMSVVRFLETLWKVF